MQSSMYYHGTQPMHDLNKLILILVALGSLAVNLPEVQMLHGLMPSSTMRSFMLVAATPYLHCKLV